MSRTLSAAQARRIAIAAQGLAAPKPGKPVTARAFRTLASRLGALQLDSVNVFARTHYMPTFARLGPYDPAHPGDARPGASAAASSNTGATPPR